jgi:hypothetical protein
VSVPAAAGGNVVIFTLEKLFAAGKSTGSVNPKSAAENTFGEPCSTVTLLLVPAGGSFTGMMVIKTGAAVLCKGAEQVRLGRPQLSGSPRSVAANVKLSPEPPL